MNEFLEISLRSFWAFCGAYAILTVTLYYLVNGVIKLGSRLLRTVNVIFRGWPPNHLDADGDYHKQKKLNQ